MIMYRVYIGCGYRAIQFFFSALRLLFLDGWDLGSGIGLWIGIVDPGS